MMRVYQGPTTEVEVIGKCPYCGGLAEVEHMRVDAWKVKCLKCGANGGTWTTWEKAVGKWNKVGRRDK